MVRARRLFPSLFVLVLLLAAYGCDAQRVPRIGPIVKVIQKAGLKKRIIALGGAVVRLFRGVKKPKPDLAGIRMCSTQSKLYKGMCFNPTNCANVCRTEGFKKGGKCGGARRRCLCTKKCF